MDYRLICCFAESLVTKISFLPFKDFLSPKILVILRLLKPHNNGTNLKGIETSFQVV
jgi:hypothetical protein